MILKGNQRGGARQLAVHLLRTDDNEHVEVHEVRGFMSDQLSEALREAYAVSRGTRCKQFLFSLSLNPPERESVPIKVFEDALDRIETKLGLESQPRAIVFHEKEGRRHAHCVWSRIDVEAMKAINLPHYKFKLRDISRELYIEHQWKMPRGLVNSEQRSPLNYTRQEWQQARRAGQDPRVLKSMFQECWAISDSRRAFTQALADRGFYLARGDRRGFVALDIKGEIYAIAKWTGIRTKEVRSRLGDLRDLPSVADTKGRIARLMTGVLKGYVNEVDEAFAKAADLFNGRRLALVQRHRNDRIKLRETQEARWNAESLERAARIRKGLRGLWDRLTGRHRQMRDQNDQEVKAATSRDRSERQSLIDTQLLERRRLRREVKRSQRVHETERARLNQDIGYYVQMAAEGSTGRLVRGSEDSPTRSRRKRWRGARDREFEPEP